MQGHNANYAILTKQVKLQHEKKPVSNLLSMQSVGLEQTFMQDDTTNIDTCEATAIIKIEESDVRVKLDTGVEVNVMPKRVYDQLKKSKKKLTKTSVKLHGYGGHNIPIIGTTRLECSANDVRKSADFYVVQTKSKMILGLTSCRDMMLVKIMDELKEKSTEISTEEGNKKNIIEENVK